jgi:hypothetical protein
VVLEPDLPIRKADPVLADEGRPEQFVRGQDLQQRVLAEHRVRDVPTEHPARQRPTDSGQPADDDVRIVLIGVVGQPLQGLVAEGVVVVTEEHVLPGRGVDPDVPRRSRPPRVLQLQHLQVRMSCRYRIEPNLGGLVRSVVAEQDLKLIRWQGLPQE